MTYTTDGDGVPIFGAGVDHKATMPFAIEIYDAKEDRTWNEYFKARRDMGGGPLMSYIRASRGDRQTQLVASFGLLTELAVDTDGLSADYKTPEPDEDGNVEEADPRADIEHIDEWSSKRRLYYYAGSSAHHIGFDAVIELAKWAVREGINLKGRPTQATTNAKSGPSSSGSSRGRTATKRGSTASRSRKAAS